MQPASPEPNKSLYNKLYHSQMVACIFTNSFMLNHNNKSQGRKYNIAQNAESTNVKLVK